MRRNMALVRGAKRFCKAIGYECEIMEVET
jgi:hypothetical protein